MGTACLCALLDLGDLAVDDLRALLAADHDLEAVEVRKLGAGLAGAQLLGPSGLVPLAVDLGRLPSLADNAGAARAGDLNRQISQGNTLGADDLALDVGAADEHLCTHKIINWEVQWIHATESHE